MWIFISHFRKKYWVPCIIYPQLLFAMIVINVVCWCVGWAGICIVWQRSADNTWATWTAKWQRRIWCRGGTYHSSTKTYFICAEYTGLVKTSSHIIIHPLLQSLVSFISEWEVVLKSNPNRSEQYWKEGFPKFLWWVMCLAHLCVELPSADFCASLVLTRMYTGVDGAHVLWLSEDIISTNCYESLKLCHQWIPNLVIYNIKFCSLKRP